MSVIIYDVETLKTPEEVAPGVLGWQNPAWPTPSFPAKIAFRRGTVLYECDRNGRRVLAAKGAKK